MKLPAYPVTMLIAGLFMAGDVLAQGLGQPAGGIVSTGVTNDADFLKGLVAGLLVSRGAERVLTRPRKGSTNVR